jgi:hypothetical protein
MSYSKNLKGQVFMPIKCKYRNSREVCTMIGKLHYGPKSHKRLFALPFNRYDPDQSIWWLSPSSENPAYKYGKFGFIPYEDNIVLIGFYVEKGLGDEYCSIAGSKAALRMVMDKDWLWHDFLKEMASEKFITILNKIAHKTNKNPEIHIMGGYANPGFEPEKPRYNWDKFEFSWDTKSNQIQNLKAIHAGNVLGKMENCNNLISLKNEISKFNENSYVWIDLFIGNRLELAHSSNKAWGAGAIVENILYPLEELVK